MNNNEHWTFQDGEYCKKITSGSDTICAWRPGACICKPPSKEHGKLMAEAPTLLAERNALLKACLLYRNDDQDDSLLLTVAEMLYNQAAEERRQYLLRTQGFAGMSEEAGRLGELADKLTEKHEAICEALSAIKEQPNEP